MVIKDLGVYFFRYAPYFVGGEVVAYKGYLLKVGNYKIPHKYISASSYKAYLNSQDLDSYRDGNGVLHRNALSHQPNKIEFNTRNMLSDKEFSAFMGNIQENYTNNLERKASVTAYIPEVDKYITQDMYISDIQPEIYSADSKSIKYKEIRIAFIGY